VLGAGLQEFAKCDQGQDNAGRLEVEVHAVLADPFRLGVTQTIADLVQGEDAVQGRGRGADRDQAVHVRRTVQQRAKTAGKIRPVDDQDRQKKKKLGQGEEHGMHLSVQPGRQRQLQHVPHGDIQKRQKGNRRPDNSFFEGFSFFGQTGAGGSRRSRCRVGRVIAGLGNGGNDVLLPDRLRVVCDGHRTGQEIDLDFFDTRQAPDAFFNGGGAGRTGHAPNLEILFHQITSIYHTPRGVL